MKFKEYMKGEFAEKAVEFIVCTGLWNPNMTAKGIAESLNIQMEQVKEETLEYLTAYGTNDTVEKVDGIIDMHFTVANFEFMGTSITKLVKDDPTNEQVFEANLNSELLDFMGVVVPTAFMLPLKIDEEILLASAQLVIENNSLKYTSSKEEVESWVFDPDSGIRIVETVVGGVTWYCLKDENGKVRKHRDFKKVEIDQIIKRLRGENE